MKPGKPSFCISQGCCEICCSCNPVHSLIVSTGHADKFLKGFGNPDSSMTCCTACVLHQCMARFVSIAGSQACWDIKDGRMRPAQNARESVAGEAEDQKAGLQVRSSAENTDRSRSSRAPGENMARLDAHLPSWHSADHVKQTTVSLARQPAGVYLFQVLTLMPTKTQGKALETTRQLK